MRIIYIGIICLLTSCVNFKHAGLWEEKSSMPEMPNINQFYALNILDEGLSSEVWFTENAKCIQVSNSKDIKFSGETGIHLKWDKKEGGCDWIGMGVGWDAWSGKNLERILDKAAIQIKVFVKEGKVKSLPLAVCLEDYSSSQAWLGMSSNNIKYVNNESWATITLPLSSFSWEEFDADASNIKQMLIQFEAGGDVYMDDIKIVPFKGSLKKTYACAHKSSLDIAVDGKLEEKEWSNATSIDLEGNSVKLMNSDDFFYISGEVNDDTPLQNSKNGVDIWNGDCFEMAFSTSTDASAKRKMFLYSDQQVGLRMSNSPMVWDFRKKREIKGSEIQVSLTNTGYQFEAKVPIAYFEGDAFLLNQTYGLELALDKGTNSGRNQQLRWNSSGAEGFHLNPSLWGRIIYKNLSK